MTEQEEFTKLVLDGWTVKELQDYYSLSRSAIYARKNKWNLVGVTPNNKPIKVAEEGNKICATCKEEKPLTDFYANGYQPNGKKKYKGTCKSCQNPINYANKKKRIVDTLAELGREFKCEHCGYDKNYAALCFHHIDPTKKDFEFSNLSAEKGITLEKIKNEIDKCIVLCHNCHMEEHYPHLNR